MSVWTDNPHLEGQIRLMVMERRSATFISRKLKIGRDLVRGKIISMGFQRGVPSQSARTEAGALPPSAPRRFSWQGEEGA